MDDLSRQRARLAVKRACRRDRFAARLTLAVAWLALVCTKPRAQTEGRPPAGPRPSGIVVGLDGTPVQGATVLFFRPDDAVDRQRVTYSSAVRQTVTDAHGVFESDVAHDGWIHAMAVSDGYAPSVPVLFAPGDAERIVLHLRRAASVSGHLRRSDGSAWSGRGVQWAQPPTVTSGWEIYNAGARASDTTGFFCLDGVSLGRIVLRVQPTALEVLLSPRSGPKGLDALLSGDVVASYDVSGEKVRVDLVWPDKSCKVQGVAQEGGTPMRGAFITAEPVGELGPSSWTYSDRTGHFELELVARQSYWVGVTRRERASAVQLSTRPDHAVWLVAGTDGPLTIDFGTVPVKGRVLASDGTGASCVLSIAEVWPGSPPALAEARLVESDSIGRFSCRLASGDYVFRAGWSRARGTGASLGKPRLVHVGEEGLRGLELSVGRSVVISGQVLDENKAPIPRAEILAWDAEGAPIVVAQRHLSDVYGRFVLVNLPAGTCSIAARAHGRAGAASLLAESDVTLSITALPAASVRIGLRTGEARSAGRAILHDVGRDLWIPADAEGEGGPLRPVAYEHAFGPLPAGRYRVHARGLNGETALEELEVATEDIRRDIVLDRER
jgi:hypothetical protein